MNFISSIEGAMSCIKNAQGCLVDLPGSHTLNTTAAGHLNDLEQMGSNGDGDSSGSNDFEELDDLNVSPNEYNALVDALVAQGIPRDEAQAQILEHFQEKEAARIDSLNNYVSDLFQIDDELAQAIVDFSEGNIDTVPGIPPEILAAILNIDIRHINGTQQAFLNGQPIDIEIIADYFGDEYGAAIGAYALSDGTWATERPLDAHLEQSGTGLSLHGFLDVLGLVPVIGEPADLFNGAIYLLEGDKLNAGLSLAAVVPIAGNFATGAKLLNKSADLIKGLDAVLVGSSKVDGITVNLLKMPDGSFVKVLETPNGTTAIVNASIDDLGEALRKANPAPGWENRLNTFERFSPSWGSANDSNVINKFTPNSSGAVSTDGVKTRYLNSETGIEVIVDNENNYLRILDTNTNQYLGIDGKPISTGHLQGQEAKDFLQQQTHFVID